MVSRKTRITLMSMGLALMAVLVLAPFAMAQDEAEGEEHADDESKPASWGRNRRPAPSTC